MQNNACRGHPYLRCVSLLKEKMYKLCLKKIQFFSIRNQLTRALQEMDNQNLQAFMQAFIVDWVK